MRQSVPSVKPETKPDWSIAFWMRCAMLRPTHQPMHDKPRPKKSLRFAFTLNLLLPGTGQLYSGQTTLGVLYLTGFGLTYVTILTLFLRAYAKYLELSTDGGILEADHLEQLSRAFPVGWLISLSVLGIAIYVASLVSLRLPRPPRDDFPADS
jgi:TM2 domain-containing membrane protein YozV